MGNINWKYFVVAAEELNFTKAAAKLYISQQSLSNYIARLENAMGMELFNRKKTLTLTAAGESLYYNAKRILAMEELAKKEAQDVRDFKTSSLRIGISVHRGSKLLPKVLPELKEKYPELKVELVEKSLKELRKELFEGRIDLMFGYAAERMPDVVYEVYSQEQIVLVIPESIWNRYIPAKKQKRLLGLEKVPLEEFAECPMVLLSEGNWLNRQLKAYCGRKNLSLNAVLYTTNIDTTVSMACAGFGAAICPEIYVREEYLGGIQKEPMHRFVLADPIFSPPRAVQYMGNRFLPKVARDFIEIVKRNP